MSIEQEEKLGAVKISDDVIAICAINAALSTKGIAGLSGGLTDAISKNILGKDPLKKGIKLSKEDDEITIDIYAIVEYGMKIPEVAWDVQKSVKNEITNMIDIPVKAVNIHVQGINFPE
jgi:uncharacterized alkaline shock family protein YloU